MPESTRIAVPVATPCADANIKRQYEIQKASWLWHPDIAAETPVFLQFRNEFTLTESIMCTLHVSADQHYELTLNGELLSCGPERSDVLHWGFASYQLTVPAGTHLLEAMVWWQGKNVPATPATYRGGFILEAQGELGTVLSTGYGAWMVAELKGVSFHEWVTHDTFTAGPYTTVDGCSWHGSDLEFKEAAVIAPAIVDSNTGTATPGWQLYPVDMADQQIAFDAPGTIRAISESRDIIGIIRPEDEAHTAIPLWNALLKVGKPVIVSAHSRQSVLWDLENYYCGFSWLNISGGVGANIHFEWAESLFDVDEEENMLPSLKGDRNAITGKFYYGFGERFIPGGGEQEEYRSFAPRAGRYVRITISTTDAPLTVNSIGIRLSGHQTVAAGSFSSSLPGINALMPLLTQGAQACITDACIDSPYYGNLMRPDTLRPAMLAGFMVAADARPARRSLELGDWSRMRTGLTAAYHPARQFVLNPLASLQWIIAVRDYAYWRNDAEWVRKQVFGTRCVIEQLLAYKNADNLLERLPGACYLDTVPGWTNGLPATGGSALINLMFIYALQNAAELELALGEKVMAERYTGLARTMGKQVQHDFWDGKRGMMRDDAGSDTYSEHAQALALLTAILPEADELECLYGLLNHKEIVHASPAFGFYLLEALYRFNRGNEILARLEPWQRMVAEGLKTPAENSGPCRADCHAGTLHPLYHLHASIAGIRPVEPGFAAVMCAPTPGPLEKIEAVIPHPAGSIDAAYDFAGGKNACKAVITLPEGVPGYFHWKAETYELKPGRENVVTVAPVF